jgi:uracil-DNA glycosylase family 4
MPEIEGYSLSDYATSESHTALEPTGKSVQEAVEAPIGIYERFPLTPSYHDAAIMYGSTPVALAEKLLHQAMEIPVLDVKGEPLRPALWIPSSQLGTGRTVSANRDFHARLMVVGKRPGNEEISNRRVFVGETGNLLRETAMEVGIGSEIEAAFGTNVLRFIPFDGGKTLKPYHIRDCLPLLAREIDIIQPRFILLLGTDAVKVFFGSKQTLQRVRHRLFLMRDVRDLGTDRIMDATKIAVDDPIWRDSIKILATVHPAAVLRETGLLEGFKADLAQMRTVMGGHVGNPTPGEGLDYRYVTTAQELAPVVNQALTESQVVAIDCEWGGGECFRGGQLRCIQFSWKPGSACVVVLRHAGLIDAQSSLERLQIISLLKEFFSRMFVVGHNFRADAPWLEDLGIPAIDRLCFDTMLADHALNENAEHGLESCVARYTNMGRYDWELSEWVRRAHIQTDDGYKDVPNHLLFAYGAADADATLRIYGVLREMLNKPENEPVARLFYRVVMPANFPLYEMERTGILVDFERMELLVHLYSERKEEMVQELRDLVKKPKFNFRSIPQVVSLLFDSVKEGGLGLTPVKTTEKPSRMWADVPEGDLKRVSPSTDAESLEVLAPSHEAAGKLRDIKIIDQITKNFLRPKEDDGKGGLVYKGGVTGEVDHDGRVRTRLSQMSETGRQRSSKPNCFDGLVEALTQYGWMTFAEVYSRRNESLKLAQFDENTNEIDFSIPLDYQQVETDELVRVFTDKQIDLLMTPDHRCLIRNREGNFKFVAANSYPEDHEQLQAGRYVGGRIAMRESQVILSCALQADGHVTKWGSYDFGFSKRRKAQRLEWALKQERISYRKYDSNRFRFYIFRENIPAWWKHKQFDAWLLDLDRSTLDFFAEEVWFWDGAWKRRSMFVSSIKKNTDWVQILTLLSNRRAKLRKHISNTGSVSWQVDAADRNYSMTTNRIIEPIHAHSQAYCVTMPKGTVIVRYNGRVAITGQCQNLPKRQDKETSRLMGDDTPKIRSCFIASPGYVLVEADYKSAEIFTLGYLSNDMKLVEDAKSDLHARGAVTRMGCPPWEGFNQGVPPPKEWLDTHKAMRVASKTISFGIPYQRGPKAIAREITKSTHGAVDCDTDMAQGFIDGFYKDYQGVGAYVDFCKSSVLGLSYIENPYGRRRRFVVSEDESFMAAQQREAVNFPIQSTVADTLNSAMFNLWQWRKQNPGRARYKILLAVHDALMLEVPVESLEVVCYEALPAAMSLGAVVPSWHAGPGGVPTSPFILDIDIEVMLRWGEHSDPEDLRNMKVSDRIINDFI